MGCSSSKYAVDARTKQKIKRGKKPPKNYAADPKYKAFIAIGAEGDPKWPNSMHIGKEKVAEALKNVNIEVQGDGSGHKEFCIMDRDFRNHVRFKDFCKFVKNSTKGQAYDRSDSSLSSSEIFEDIIRDMWKECDTTRNCEVPLERAQTYISNKFDLKTQKEAIMVEMDENKDSVITF